MSRLNKLVIYGLAALGGAAAILALYRFNPVTSRFYPQCLLHSFTGLHCPGCGALRAAHALLHGHFRAAVAFNPLFVLLAPIGAGFCLVNRLRDKNWTASRIAPGLIWGLFAIIVLYAIARNIPFAPFTSLVP